MTIDAIRLGLALLLLTAVYIVIMAGFLFYAKEVLVKLVTFVKGRLEVGELTVGLTSEKIADSGHQEPKPPDEVSPPPPSRIISLSEKLASDYTPSRDFGSWRGLFLFAIKLPKSGSHKTYHFDKSSPSRSPVFFHINT